MKERKDERWLDELISRTINTTKPQFDPEQWQQKYPEEFQILKSRARQRPTPPGESIWKSILQNRFTKLAAAAAIIVAIGLFLGRNVQTPIRPATGPRPVAQSPIKKMSLMSMRIAYQRGGLDALDRQFRDTLDLMGPQSLSISMQELLEGVNGS